MAVDLLVTGVGIESAIGQGQPAFSDSLLQGQSRFDYLRRAGRIREEPFIGAEIDDLILPLSIDAKILRTASFSEQVALATLAEAWNDAKLGEVDPSRIGLVVGGSNFNQRFHSILREDFRGREKYIRPNYGFSFLDSDLAGICSEAFGIEGQAYTVGGASASGQIAFIQAAQNVLLGNVDVCIALGALMDLSHWELQALKSLGALGSDKFKDCPQKACRPFDRDRDGFIFGEGCAAIVVERADRLAQRSVRPYCQVRGWSLVSDGNRNPNPSVQGEIRAISQALESAHIQAKDIDYINPHGTASIIGDETELTALKQSGLVNSRINSTKSITGHCLTAAGAVEIVAVLVQMRHSKLHPSLNCENPIDRNFQWVGTKAEDHQFKYALTLSMGFGGINSAVCLENLD